jgi:predicted permease
LRAVQTSFSSITGSAVIFPPVTTTGNAEVVAAEAVDGLYFTTFGVGPRLGRAINASDDAAAAPVVVLSHELWRGRFAADPAILGRTVRVAGQPFEIIGVMPASFRGPYWGPLASRLWISVGAERALSAQDASPVTAAPRSGLTVFGRLAPGVSLVTASAQLGTIARIASPSRGAAADERARPSTWVAKPVAGVDREDSGVRRMGVTLLILIALVLIVACTNLANLVLARGTARQGELAVRMAMGASRGRLVWEQCVESAILASLGGMASYAMFLGVSAMMTQDFTILAPPLLRMTVSIRPTLNPEALGVAGVSTLLCLAVFGLEPAIHLARRLDIRGALAAGATGIRPRVARQRMVIRWQVAVAAGFFIVSTMFIRATIEQSRHDPGVALDRIAVATLDFQSGQWDEARIRRTIDRVMDEGRHENRVEGLSASTGLPFGIPPALQVAIARPGPDQEAEINRSHTAAVAASPSFFNTLGIAIVAGRAFTDDDRQGTAPVLIVSELMARQLFGSATAVGEAVALRVDSRATETATIVGVARNTDVGGIYSRPRPLVYLPINQQFHRSITITARSTGPGAAAVQPLREAIARADTDLGVDVVASGRAALSGPFELVRSGGKGTLYLGAFTLVLSMVGLFGVQSHVVAYRTREIGVRMAVGGTAAQIKRMVMTDGYRPVIEGLVLGLWGGIAGRFIVRASTEVDVAIFDMWMLVVTPIPLVLAAFCACYLPAARASRVDPTVALRCE